MYFHLRNALAALFFLLSVMLANAQTRGMIYEPATGAGGVVLDPNQDGYISQSVSGFINNDQAESEIPYMKLVFPGTEPTHDIRNGPNCGFTDFVDSGTEDPAQYYLDAANNLLFRLRMGSTAPNAKSYSILIDTDGKFGSTGPDADPNYTAANPGFEIEIVLATKFGVFVYNVDGVPNCSPVISYPGHTNYQKAIAHSSICNDYNYFLDFFVSFNDLTSIFGITPATPIRMAIVDNMAANKSTLCNPNSASDIGGIDDRTCGSLENCFRIIIDNYTPCPANSALACQDRSACPSITGPVGVGAVSISGTSSEVNGTLIRVYRNGTEIGTTTVSGGAWTLSGVSGLALNDIITATATAPGKTESFDNCSTKTVVPQCTPATTTNAPADAQLSTISGNKGIRISNVTNPAGMLIRMYNPDGSLFDASILKPGSVNPITTVAGTTTYNFECQTGQCFLSGVYYISFQEIGKCESTRVPYCFNTTGTTAAASITSPATITSATTSVSGTVASPDNLAGRTILLNINGIQVATGTTTAGGDWTINNLVFSPCDQVTVRAIASGKCYSVLSTPIQVSGEVTSTPLITGDYCVSSPVTTVTGTSSEPAGTLIQLYLNGGGSAIGSTTVSASGTWTVTGLSIAPGNSITARATSTCNSQSPHSAAVVVTAKTISSVSISTSPVYEGTTTISGTGNNGDIIHLWVDGYRLPDISGTVSGGSWTITGIPDYEIFAEGTLTATASAGPGCPSDPSTGVPILCIAPINNLTVTPADTSTCASSMTVNVRLPDSESLIIYQLFNDASPTGSSRLGTGNLITLTSGTISSSTKLNIRAMKLPPGTCFTTLTDSVQVNLYSDPLLDRDVSAVSPVCSGAASEVFVENSQVGYNYQLRDDSDNSLVGTPVAGTGGTISLPVDIINGNTTFNVLVSGQAPSICSDQLTQTVMVAIASCDADLSITKSVDNSSPDVGNTIVFTLTVSNAGPGNATGIVVSDLLPDGYTYISDNGGGTYDAGTGIWTVGSLANSGSASLEITVSVNADGDYLNTVSVTGDQNDPDLTNNTSSSNPTPGALADLSIDKELNNPTPVVGNTVVFTIIVNNAGPSDAADVVVTDLLPAGYSYVSDNGGGAYNSGTGTWTIGNLADGISEILEITATVESAGNIYTDDNYLNTASVVSSTNDPNLVNNISSVRPGLADLGVSKIADNINPLVGETVEFTITAVNNGPDPAIGVRVIEPLPAGFTYVSSVPSTGTFDNMTGVWNIGDLNNGESATLSVIADVNASGSYTNIVFIEGTQTDVVPGNDSDTLEIIPVPVADLSLQKMVNNTDPYVGSNVVFTLIVTNSGPSYATGVTVTDQLPSGYIYVSDNGGGAYNSSTGIWSAGNIANGASLSLQITALVNPAGIYLNSATVTSAVTDPDLSNNDDTENTSPIPVADLSISKIVDNSTPDVGSNVVFTITVSNAGPSDATGVEVTDQLPSGYTYVSDNSAGSYNNSTGLWTAGDIASGSSASLEITATVNPNGIYLNTATITSSDQHDPDGDNDEDTEETTPVPVADLSISKIVDESTPDVGSNVVFTITVSNAGPSDATGVELTDQLPSGYTYVSDNSAGAYNSSTGLWAAGAIANGSSASLEITATVNSNGIYLNTATITSSDQNDPEGDNDEDTEETTPVPQADLYIFKTVNDASPDVGENITFTLTVGNNGPSDATGVVVTDMLPSGYSYQSDNGSGAYNNSAGIWNAGIIASGASVSLEIVVTVNASGNYLNIASVAGNENDPDLTNNTSSSDPDPGAVADLSISKTVDNSTPDVGSDVVFTITVSNAGPSDATGIVVTDQLPSGYTYVSDNSAGAYDNSTGLWTAGAIANGSSASLEITATVNANGIYLNTATITSSDQHDPDGDNDEDTEETTPVPVADLSVSIAADDMSPDVGQTIVFTITVNNAGPSNASGVEVLSLLPDGFTYVSDNGGGSYNNGTGIWTIGNLSEGGNVSIEITVTVNASGTYLTTAEVSGNENDPDLANNTSSSNPAPGAVADLSISKTVDNTTPDVGSDVVFTITVSNDGPSDATGIVVTDQLPSGYTYVSDNSAGAYDNSTGLWTAGAIANGSSASLEITATVNANGIYLNTATITSSDQNDPDGDNDEDTEETAPVPVADLSVSIAADDMSPDVGQTIVFIITVNNAGPSDATGVEVLSLLPDGFTYVSDNGGGSYNNGTGIWTIGNLSEGGNVSIEITVTVNASGTYLTTAEVSGNENDPDLANNTSSSNPAPGAVADLSISKTVNNATPDVGSNVVFTITVSNDGPSDATGIVVTDQLPSGYTYVSDNSAGAYDSSTGLWTAGAIANGSSASLEITATVNANGIYLNTATITSSDQHDPDGDNDEDTEETTPVPVADLSVSIAADDMSPDVGQTIVFTITVNNAGPSNSTGVEVLSLLPDGFTYVSDNGGGSYNNGTGIWTIGNLSEGGNVSIEITVTVNTSGTYLTTAEVSGNENDPDLTNNTSSSNPDPGAVADLSISKTVDNTTPDVGSNVVFTITVGNAGPSDATGVEVTDQLPSGYAYVSDNSAGAYNSSTGAWTIGSLVSGANAVLQITVSVNVSGNYLNIATVSADQNDPDGDNNTSEAEVVPVVISTSADLSVVKTADNMNPYTETMLTFTITASNSGPDPATGIIVSDTLKDGYTFISSSANKGTYNAATGTWNIGALESDSSAQLVIQVRVNKTGEHGNMAWVAGNEYDPDLTNNSSLVVPDVRILNLSIPEGFSPNNDGINDYFVITGIENYPGNLLNIYNRWGNKVYESKGYQNDWDGTNKFGYTIGGSLLPVGTYFYILDLGEKSNDGDQIIKGFIYLNR